ncbi:unnamed protein product, partial [Penicillium nalgiovense]
MGSLPRAPVNPRPRSLPHGCHWLTIGYRRCQVRSQFLPFAMSLISALLQQFPLSPLLTHHAVSYCATEEFAYRGGVHWPQPGPCDFRQDSHSV